MHLPPTQLPRLTQSIASFATREQSCAILLTRAEGETRAGTTGYKPGHWPTSVNRKPSRARQDPATARAPRKAATLAAVHRAGQRPYTA